MQRNLYDFDTLHPLQDCRSSDKTLDFEIMEASQRSFDSFKDNRNNQFSSCSHEMVFYFYQTY